MERSPFAAPLVALTMLLGVFATFGPTYADMAALVFINGRPTHVSFNDGDSFRMKDGPYRGTQARLGGFNTLETFGPAHWWGGWHPYELYVNSKIATLNGRRGTWHCTTNEEKDTYGRILMDCPDLGVDHIRKGLAHAMTVTDEPSRPEYLRAQQDAIRNRRGMWAKGVTDFVLTSLHSADEGYPDPYNRMVSTRDGHSEKWKHHDTYDECERVCAMEDRVDVAKMDAAARRMREHPELGPLLADKSNLNLIEFASRFTRKDEVPDYVPEPLRKKLTEWLAGEKRAGRLGDVHMEKGGCLIYVVFERRYGDKKAACLKGHGPRP
ncbi:MAG: thermonuclease family protein [Myxococcales bacterium]|nr:thermonuclease family protein [Myxococcales bacterium]